MEEAQKVAEYKVQEILNSLPPEFRVLAAILTQTQASLARIEILLRERLNAGSVPSA